MNIEGKRIILKTKTKTDFTGKGISFDKTGVIMKNGKVIVFIPIDNIDYIQFSSRNKVDFFDILSNESNEKTIQVKIRADNKERTFPVNRDYFEEYRTVLRDLEARALKRELMYINNKLYLSNEKAVEAILSSSFPIKVNGRLIDNIDDLSLEEKSFLGDEINDKFEIK